MNAIRLCGVVKRFDATPVLTDVDLDVPDGSFTTVLGASGSGKTTLLRLVAGFAAADDGVIELGGRTVDDGRRSVRPQDRGVGYVPQEGALFPHLTVAGNVGFGVPRRQRGQLADLIDLVGLEGLERRYPHQLSGGQQRRAALARALAIRPRVVLLDEPFGSLDASLRDSVRRDVARILDEQGATAVLVTHDQDEALALSDQVAVLRDGRIVVATDPRTLYRQPPDVTTASAVGDANLLEATADGDRAACVLGDLPLHGPGGGVAAGVTHPVTLLLRPEQLALRDGPGPGRIPATVTRVDYHGHDTVVRVEVEQGGTSHRLTSRVPGGLSFDPGQRVWVEVQGTARPVTADGVTRIDPPA